MTDPSSKKMPPPPLPPMFRLHAPISDAGTDAKNSGVGGEGKGGRKRWPSPPNNPPAANASGVPSLDPSHGVPPKPANAESNPSEHPKDIVDARLEDIDSLTNMAYRKLSAPKAGRGGGEGGGSRDVNEKGASKTGGTGRKGSIDGKIRKSPPKSTANGWDSDSSDDERSGPVGGRSKIGMKVPRNSAVAEAYARREAEMKEQARDEGNPDGEQKAEEGGDGGMGLGSVLTTALGTVLSSAKTMVGMEDGEAAGNGDVDDIAAAVVASDKKGGDASPSKRGGTQGAGNLKSPPEEVAASFTPARPTKSRESSRPTRSKTTRKVQGGGVKDSDTVSLRRSKRGATESKPKPTEAVAAAKANEGGRAVGLRRSTRGAVSKPTSAIDVTPSSRASRSKRKRQGTRAEAAAIIAVLETDQTAAETDTSSRRSKRARTATGGAPVPKKKATKEATSKKTAGKKETATRKKPKKSTPGPRTRPVTVVSERMQKTWDERVGMLKAFKATHGTCDISVVPRSELEPLLRSFVFEARKQYKLYMRYKKSSMTDERVAELRDLGFDFCPLESGQAQAAKERRLQQSWDVQFEVLERYKAEHGDCLVNTTLRGVTDVERRKLANWVRSQRKLFIKVGGRKGMDPVKLAKLEGLGFDFNPGHNGSGASNAKKRIAGFPKRNAKWMEHYGALLQYKEKHGNILIGPTDEDFPGLYNWIHCQRKAYVKFQAGDEKAAMCDEWVNKMNDLGFDWAPMKSGGVGKHFHVKQRRYHSAIWDKHYNDLKKFQKKHGHCYVSKKNSKLANWIHLQRKNRVKRDQGVVNSMTDERIALLDKIGFDWSPMKSGTNKFVELNLDEQWEGTFQKLVAYKKKKGHPNPTKREKTLGSWCSKMRSLYARNKRGEKTVLTDKRIAKLESIGFQWTATYYDVGVPGEKMATRTHPKVDYNEDSQEEDDKAAML